MGLIPFFVFMIDGKKIGKAISLSIHDEVGDKTDSITATVSDAGGFYSWPDMTGKKCSALIGYIDGGSALFEGYKLDKITYDMTAQTFTISGQSVDFSKEAKAKKTRTHKDITIEALVAKMAGENKLKPRVSDELKPIFFKSISQNNETNLNFLVKLAKDYGATVKVGNGHLLFIERGKGKNASGDDLPVVLITPIDLLSGSTISEQERPKYKSVIAKYFDAKTSTDKTEKAGSGEPQLSLKKTYPDKQAAKAAATAEFNNKKRETCVFNAVIEGDVGIIAETPIKTLGVKSPDVSDWIVQSVDHSVGSGGFVTSFTAEQKI